MTDPAVVIKDLLVAASVGVFNTQAAGEWNICIGVFPDNKDECILVNQSGGRTPYPHLSYNEPSIQVMVRGARSGYVGARTKMDGAVTALLGLPGYNHASGDVYRSCNQIGDVIWLGQDDNTRPIFSANFWCVVLPVASGYRVAIN